MDFLKTLQSFEDAVYEIVLWILLLPKTLFQIIGKPAWMRNYVTKEWDKKPEERFQDYLSPVIFWLLLAVIPFAWYLSLESHEPDITDQKVVDSAISLLITPIAYSVVIQKLHRKPIERVSFKRSFYIQCYCHAPIQLFSSVLALILFLAYNTYLFPPQLFSIAFGLSLSNDISFGFLLGAIIYIFVLFFWQIILEVFIFRQELNLGWIKAIGWVVAMQFVITLFSLPFFVTASFNVVTK